MQRVRIGVVRGGYGSGDAFQVYAVSAGGEIDWEHPITPRRQLFWPEAEPFAAHLRGGHLARWHLDSVSSDGHLQGTHLLDAAMRPAATVSYEAGPHVFARLRYVVAPEDAAGNRGEAIPLEIAVSGEPAAAVGLLPVGFEGGQLRFTFTPSARLTG